jgi:hypothetical protein
VVNPKNPHNIFYNDLSKEETEPYIKALQPHSYRTFYSTLSFEPRKYFPSTYIICENDMAIPLSAQEQMVAAAKADTPGAFDVVERCSASHNRRFSASLAVGESELQHLRYGRRPS